MFLYNFKYYKATFDDAKYDVKKNVKKYEKKYESFKFLLM